MLSFVLTCFLTCFSSSVGQPAPGQETPINRSDPAVYETAAAAVVFINTERGLSGQEPKRNLLSVENGTVQVVDGQIYRLDIILTDSVCMNTKENLYANSTECPTLTPVPVEPCKVQILYKHWEELRSSVQYAYCQDNVFTTRVPPGGQHPVNMSDPDVRNSANWAVSQINIDRGFSLFRPRESLFAIVNGTVQEVDGKVYRLHFTIGDSKCSNLKIYSNATSEQCPVKNNVWLKHCFATVLYNSWQGQQTYKVQNYSCEKSIDRRSSLSLSSPEAVHVTNSLANVYNAQLGYSCCTYKYVVAEIQHASSSLMMLNGFNATSVNVTFKMGESFCTNNDLNADRTNADCTLQPGVQLIQCEGSANLLGDGTTSMPAVHCHSQHQATPHPAAQ